MWKAHKNIITKEDEKAAKFLKENGFITSKIYGNLARIANDLALPLVGDNTRFLQMGLLSQEIQRKNIPGSIAELGVYRGSFTRFISKAFKNRRYYLFDTFEGFNQEQVIKDSMIYGAEAHDFSTTSEEYVMGMIDLENSCEVVVRKGLFPITAKDIEDTFCFVSIDVDLYDPTMDGLNFFYPKMERGGYILIHDLMANRYKGCREAIYDFCSLKNIAFVPLPDAICSALIVKN